MAGCGPSNFRECIYSGSKSPESLIDYTFAFSSYSDFDAVLDSEHSVNRLEHNPALVNR